MKFPYSENNLYSHVYLLFEEDFKKIIRVAQVK